MSETSVIILNFNRRKEVLRLLVELKKQTFQDFEILVVDNCSSDGSVMAIRRRFPKARLVELEKNYGKAGFNFGMKKAKGEYLILFDSDVLPEKNVVEKYLKRLRGDERLGLVCPAVYLEDGKYFGPAYDKRKKTEDGGFEILFFCGSSVGLKKKVFEKVGGYEERFFMCLEELEWATRMRLAGFKIQVFPEIKVYNMKSTQGGGYRSRLGYFYTRNWIWYYAKYLPLSVMGRFLKRHIGSVGYRTTQERSMRLSDVILGGLAGFLGVLGFLKERKVLPIKLVKQLEKEVFGELRKDWREGVSTRREDDFKKNLPSLQF